MELPMADIHPEVTVGHVHLRVADLERALKFYRDVLGLHLISPDMKGPVFLEIGDARPGVPHQIVLVPRPEGLEPFPERYMRNLHHIGLEVSAAALAEERDRLIRLGFEVRTGEHPFLSVEAIYIDDPDGNEIELVARK